MQSQTSINTIASNNNTEIKVYRYRWVILLIYGFVALVNFMQTMQFVIIANITQSFYKANEFVVDLTMLTFFISYIVLFYPVSFFIEKYNLKITMITSAALTLAGSLLKLAASEPDRIWVVLIAQTLIALAQIFLCSIPTKLATTWFGPEEVSTACAIAVFTLQFGSAFGCLYPTLLVHENSSEVSSEFFHAFIYQAIATSLAFIVVLVFFKSQPPLPPSRSQMNLLEEASHFTDSMFLTHMKNLGKDKNFWFILLSLGTTNGILNCFGVLLNTVYLNYFPNGGTDAGIVGLTTTLAGCFGILIFGILLDKTHKFKAIGFGILTIAPVSYGMVFLCFFQKSRIGSFITIPIFGIFSAPCLIVGFEYLAEVTYPIPEECSSSAFNAGYYFIAIIFTIFGELFISYVGYLGLFIFVLAALSCAAAIILLVRSDLKRRDANLNKSESTVKGAISSYRNERRDVTVSVAKF